MYEYKVTLQRPFKADKTTAVVHAHTAADACTQAKVHFKGDGDLRVTEVEPTAKPGDDDPDRVKFRADLADAAPPMGNGEINRLKQELDATTRWLKTLMGAVQGTPSVGPIGDVFASAMDEASRLRKVDKQMESLCRAVYPEPRLGTQEHLVHDSIAEIERLRKKGSTVDDNLVEAREELDHALQDLAKVCVAINPESDKDKGTWVDQAVAEAKRLHKRIAHLEGAVANSFQDTARKLVALQEKFDQAVKVIEVFEVSYPLRDSQRAAVAEFRQYHPKPGP